jgi:hypothetical protein
VGQIISYGHSKQHLSAAQLKQCNAGLQPPAQTQAKPSSQQPPATMLKKTPVLPRPPATTQVPAVPGKDFDSLQKGGKSRIPKQAPEWASPAASDPGRTLIKPGMQMPEGGFVARPQADVVLKSGGEAVATAAAPATGDPLRIDFEVRMAQPAEPVAEVYESGPPRRIDFEVRMAQPAEPVAEVYESGPPRRIDFEARMVQPATE